MKGFFCEEDEEPDVYHVLWDCPSGSRILRDTNREYEEETVPIDGREPCLKCIRQAAEWLNGEDVQRRVATPR